MSPKLAGILAAFLLALSACSILPGYLTEAPAPGTLGPNSAFIGRGLTLPRGSVVYDCGPEALAAVLRRWGRAAGIESISSALYSESHRGTIASDLVKFAQEMGLSAEPRDGSIGALKNAVDRGAPPIIMVRTSPTLHHYFVVVGYDDAARTVYCLDYDGFYRMLSYALLEDLWAPTRRAMIELGPGTGETEYELGAAAEKHGRYEEAVRHYRKAVELAPRHVEARVAMGNCLLAQGKTDEARRVYEEALLQAPADPTALNNLAHALLELRRETERAEKMAEEAAEIFGRELERIEKELAAAGQGPRREELLAEREVRAARVASALGTLGEARFQAGKFTLAASAWTGSLGRFPADRRNARARRMLDLARANRELGMASVARDWLQKALAEARDPALKDRIRAEMR